MKQYLEQRIESLEKEVEKLKSKNGLLGTDYLYNPSLNLLSEPDLETAFASPFDMSEISKNPLDTLTITLSGLSDSWFATDDLKFNFDEKQIPTYPDIIGSWDSNPEDVMCDEYGFKYNYDDVMDPISSTWNNFNSQFDLMDKDFLEWLNSNEIKPLYQEHLKSKNKLK